MLVNQAPTAAVDTKQAVSSQAPSLSNLSRSVVVTSLRADFTTEMVKACFDIVGPIHHVFIIDTDSEGKSKFCVVFATPELAKRAILLDNAEVAGSHVRVLPSTVVDEKLKDRFVDFFKDRKTFSPGQQRRAAQIKDSEKDKQQAGVQVQQVLSSAATKAKELAQTVQSKLGDVIDQIGEKLAQAESADVARQRELTSMKLEDKATAPTTAPTATTAGTYQSQAAVVMTKMGETVTNTFDYLGEKLSAAGTNISESVGQLMDNMGVNADTAEAKLGDIAHNIQDTAVDYSFRVKEALEHPDVTMNSLKETMGEAKDKLVSAGHTISDSVGQLMDTMGVDTDAAETKLEELAKNIKATAVDYRLRVQEAIQHPDATISSIKDTMGDVQEKLTDAFSSMKQHLRTSVDVEGTYVKSHSGKWVHPSPVSSARNSWKERKMLLSGLYKWQAKPSVHTLPADLKAEIESKHYKESAWPSELLFEIRNTGGFENWSRFRNTNISNTGPVNVPLIRSGEFNTEIGNMVDIGDGVTVPATVAETVPLLPEKRKEEDSSLQQFGYQKLEDQSILG
eukprot:GILK01011873.1.p1 GENE.GILK01011873.1~~GILK01011873.1.p1  ORF type:complete len:566 (-),score=107.95 GILK01011873.1:197-1894(-)